MSAGSGIQVSTSTGSVIVQSIDTLELVTARGNSSTSVIYLSNITQSASTTTGALTIDGGVGIRRDVYVGGGINVSGVSTFTNSIIGRITTASNILGGTAGALPYQFASGETQFIGIGVVGSVLTSNGTTPTYQTTQTLVVGFANRSTTATNLALGTAGQVVFQGSAGLTAFTGGTGSEGNLLVSRGTGTPTFQNTLTLAGTTQATSTLSGTLQVRGGAGIGGDLYVGGTAIIGGSQVVTAANLSQFGVAQIVAGTAIAISPAEGTGTVTITNVGVRSITSGSGITVSTSTGSITIASIDTFQLVTQRGATTNQPISITATNLSSTTATGQALLVSGGIGAQAVYASNLFDSGNRVITSVVPSAGNGISVTSVNTSNGQMTFTINNTGVTSVTGTTYIGVSSPTGAVQFTNLGVQTLTAGTDTAVSASTGTVTVWNTSTLQTITNRGFTTTNRINVTNATVSTSTETGAITVVGGIGVQGDIYARNIYTNGQIVGGQSSTSTNLAGGTTGALVYQSAPGVTSFIGIGTSGTILVSNGTTATWQSSAAVVAGTSLTATNIAAGALGSIPYQISSGQTRFIGIGPAGSVLYSNGSTATYISTGSLYVRDAIYATTATHLDAGVAGQIPYQTAIGRTSYVALGTAGAVLVSGGSGAPVYQSTLTLAGTVPSTSTLTGTLVVGGGVGIGGNVWIGGTLFASIDGSISTASNISGGTAGSIVYQEALGRTRFIGVGSNGNILQSNGSTATFVSTTTLLVGTAVNAGASLNLGGGTLGSIPYQLGLNSTGFIGIGPNTALLQSNGTTATWATTATITVASAIVAGTASRLAGGAVGSIPYQSATGLTEFIGIGPAGTILQSNGSTASWFSTGTALVGSSVNINGGQAGFIPYQDAPGVTRFISTGTRGALLQMGANTATFVATGSIIVGFANQSVNATNAAEIIGGVAGQLVYQSASNVTDFVAQGLAGTVLVAAGTGAPVWQNTLTLAGTVNATNSQSGVLVVNGGVGIAKDLYVGGVLYATVSGSINTATNLAGGAQGSIPVQTAAGVTSLLPIGVNGTMLRSNGTTLQYVTTTSLHVGTADNATGVINIAGGTAGSIPYQIGVGSTRFIGIGANGTLLQSNGTTATWVSTGSLVAGIAERAINIAGGAANQVPYQTASSATAFSSNLTFNGTSLTVGGAANATSFIPTAATVPTNGLYGTSNQVGIATNSTSRIFILSNGFVGVNTTSPNAILDVNGGVLISGVSTFTNILSSTSLTSAGVDIDGGLSVGLNVKIFGGYQAVSSSTGALTVAGGIGATGNIWAREIYADSIDVRANAVIMATAFS